ncbi:peptide chain release factor 2 [Euzebya tangerina]|uniref:peptide chain release factor 2 n=1 Tax=Euzebya tangerina TaxID=591198 RepID=UPI0039C8AF59
MATDHHEALAEYRQKLAEVKEYLDTDTQRARLAELQIEAAQPDLWDDPQAAQQVTKELSAVEDDVRVYDSFAGRLEDLEVLNQLAVEEDDAAASAEVEAALDGLATDFAELEIRVLLSGEYDARDAVVTVHAGAGGTDSQDWGEMLWRMVRRWAETRRFTVELYETQWGDEAGIRSATFAVKGSRAYGWLRSEHGVHRLVRISPFDSQARRHTAFASIDVIPEIDEANEDVTIEPDDLRVDVYRSSGPGGQGVNTTDSAVRLTHIPTGIVTSCQNERSQLQNKATAMALLKTRLAQLEREKREAELAEVRGEQRSVEWGSQIRSYVLHPYQMVKDHRTDFETGNTAAVLDGDLDGMMTAFLQWEARQNVDAGRVTAGGAGADGGQ